MKNSFFLFSLSRSFFSLSLSRLSTLSQLSSLFLPFSLAGSFFNVDDSLCFSLNVKEEEKSDKGF